MSSWEGLLLQLPFLTLPQKPKPNGVHPCGLHHRQLVLQFFAHCRHAEHRTLEEVCCIIPLACCVVTANCSAPTWCREECVDLSAHMRAVLMSDLVLAQPMLCLQHFQEGFLWLAQARLVDSRVLQCTLTTQAVSTGGKPELLQLNLLNQHSAWPRWSPILQSVTGYAFLSQAVPLLPGTSCCISPPPRLSPTPQLGVRPPILCPSLAIAGPITHRSVLPEMLLLPAASNGVKALDR